jgi:beta-galactosidase
MAHAMGVNTVCTYAFWNLHEPREGQFDFSSGRDVAEFCRLAQQEGLKVIVRPGPYVCAEWDMGGLPWWLLKTPDIQLRSRDARFMAASRRWFTELGKQLAPLQASHGGPIIMIQVENEYGSWGTDREYLVQLRGFLREAGFDVPVFTTDLAEHLPRAFSTNFHSAVNFGQDPAKHFALLTKLQPEGTQMCQEYFTGWYDIWGRNHSRAKPERKIADVEWMLREKKSFNLYMVHGGTSFGFYAGANELPYRPVPTSYDYDAPITEAGWTSPKYEAFRKLFSRYLPPGETLPEIPGRLPVIGIPAFELAECAPLLENLPEATKSDRPRTMEYFDQGYGCILYQAALSPGAGERLVLKKLHDFCTIFIDGERVGQMDRNQSKPFYLPARTNSSTLKLLVEAMGRVHYGPGVGTDRKGITEKVFLEGRSGVQELRGWEVFNLPLDANQLSKCQFKKGRAPRNMPAFYRANFELKEVGDTFLDMRAWGRGVVWVNGQNLGRFWRLGPQQTLYCPGPWLKKGMNEVIVLEMFSPDNPVLKGLPEPVLDEVAKF